MKEDHERGREAGLPWLDIRLFSSARKLLASRPHDEKTCRKECRRKVGPRTRGKGEGKDLVRQSSFEKGVKAAGNLSPI